MLAGVGAVDACLFVVAATEGWKPQSEEHLRILELLGISRGMIALTKVALAGRDLAELAALEITESVRGTFLAGCEIVGVDVPAGLGLAELRAALDRWCREPRPPGTRAGRGCGWTGRSRSAAPAASSPGRSPADRCPSATG